MTSKRIALIAVGAFFYCALALAVIIQAPAIERIGKRLPRFVLGIVLTAVGPIALFAEGVNAWPVVAVVLVLIVICLGDGRRACIARITARRSRNSCVACSRSRRGLYTDGSIGPCRVAVLSLCARRDVSAHMGSSPTHRTKRLMSPRDYGSGSRDTEWWPGAGPGA